jgi:nicotinamidase-related amidase
MTPGEDNALKKRPPLENGQKNGRLNYPIDTMKQIFKEALTSDRQLMMRNTAEEITEVYIGGIYAEASICKTTKCAFMHNYITTILMECIATRKETGLDKIIPRYQSMGAKII